MKHEQMRGRLCNLDLQYARSVLLRKRAQLLFTASKCNNIIMVIKILIIIKINPSTVAFIEEKEYKVRCFVTEKDKARYTSKNNQKNYEKAGINI